MNPYKECIFENKPCTDCGKCDMCELDPTKRCDNCMKCVNNGAEYRAVYIDRIENEQEKNDK